MRAQCIIKFIKGVGEKRKTIRLIKNTGARVLDSIYYIALELL